MSGGAPPRPARTFALLGRPVEHSVSPALYRTAFRRLGLSAGYEARAVDGRGLEAALRAYARRGGGNVTLPHKERAAAALELRSDAVAATGACNCFWADEDGRLAGDNTDVEGFLAAVRAWRGEGCLAGARVLLLGAGGAARAVLHACLRAGAARVEVRNRTESRARALAAELGGAGDRVVAGALLPPSAGEEEGRLAQGPGTAWELVVNATSLGLRADDPLPLSLEGPAAVGAAMDLVYGPDGTAWTRHARSRGVPARDGLDMLVRQAGLALLRWFPDVAPPLEAMRGAARAALAARAPAGRSRAR